MPPTLLRLVPGLVLAALAVCSPVASQAAPTAAPTATAPAALATAAVHTTAQAALAGYEGVVEALRQTVLAAQVPGAVVELRVRPGDRVAAGQVLARIDARAADQTAAAGDAQVVAARAALDAAQREFDRQRQLFQKQYISAAALERAEAQFKAAQAQATGQLAQAEALRTQSGFGVVRAPYAGVVSEVPVSLGDMAMPGRPLVTLYDPAALRVAAAVPQAVALAAASGPVRIELPGVALPAADGGRIVPARVTVLPAFDPATHTAQLRLDLPAGLVGVAPGLFARVWLTTAAPVNGAGSPAATAVARLFVPAVAVVRRAELTAVYVVDDAGRPLLRQVRLGPAQGDHVEVLAGLAANERVAVDPAAASRVR
jgi:RND family efflux transporter MFP subunit